MARATHRGFTQGKSMSGRPTSFRTNKKGNLSLNSVVWLQVQLDGSVRTSGNRMPDFDQLVSDLPPLDSLRSALMDGVGPQDE